MKPIVVDCSASGPWFLADEQSANAEALLRQVLRRNFVLVQPSLWHYEVTNMLCLARRRKRITQEQLIEVLAVLQALPVSWAALGSAPPHEILDFAARHHLTAYDAAYLCVARSHDAMLITADTDLLALRSCYPWVRSLTDIPCVA